MTADRALTWFIRIWIGLLLILLAMSFAKMMVAAPTFRDGLARIRDELEPFNFRFYLTGFLALSPALLALSWRDRRRRRARNSSSSDTR